MQVARVELIQVHHIDVYKWLRKNLNLNVVEANHLSKNGSFVCFDDFKMAMRFYLYLINQPTSSARLIIDHTFDSTGCYGSFGVTIEEAEENEKYYKELEEKGLIK